MRATRNRQFPRPASMTEPVVRHEVWMVPTNRPARRLHGGIAIPAEAQALFRQASRDMDEATGPEFSIVLERHTVETLAMRRGPGVIVYAAEKPAEIQPLPTTGADEQMSAIRRFSLAAIAKAFGVPMRFLRDYDPAAEARKRDAEGLEVARHIGEVVNRLPYRVRDGGAFVAAHREPRTNPLDGMTTGPHAGTFVTVIAPTERGPLETVQTGKVLRAAFVIAAHHQGGHSSNGRLLAEALGVPFPLTMPDLAARAEAIGFDPKALWPWREVPGCRDADVATAD
jgi:hypothetical protein